MAEINIVKITPFFPRGIFVQWDVTDLDGTLGAAYYDIERSESPAGPFRLLTPECRVYDHYSYFDYSVPVNAFDRFWYYRIRADNIISDAVTYTVRKELLTNRLQGEILKMQSDFSTLLEVDNGSKILIYKRKHSGDACTCFDPTTKFVTTTNCSSCYGTRYVGGYYNPIQTLASFESPPVDQVTGPEGESQSVFMNLKMLDVPLLVPDDLIFEVDSGDLYEVKRVIHTRRQRITVHQEVTTSLLHRSAPQYRLVSGERNLGIELVII